MVSDVEIDEVMEERLSGEHDRLRRERERDFNATW